MFLAFVLGCILGHCATVFLFVVAKSHVAHIVGYTNKASSVARKVVPAKKAYIIDGEYNAAEERRERILKENSEKGAITYLRDL